MALSNKTISFMATNYYCHVYTNNFYYSFNDLIFHEPFLTGSAYKTIP